MLHLGARARRSGSASKSGKRKLLVGVDLNLRDELANQNIRHS